MQRLLFTNSFPATLPANKEHLSLACFLHSIFWRVGRLRCQSNRKGSSGCWAAVIVQVFLEVEVEVK